MSAPDPDHPFARMRALMTMLAEHHVSSTAWRVAVALATGCDGHGRSDLSWAQLGGLTGLARRQVAAGVAELRAEGFAVQIRAADPSKRIGARYRVAALARPSSPGVRESTPPVVPRGADSRVSPVRISALDGCGSPHPLGNDLGKNLGAAPIVNRAERRRRQRAMTASAIGTRWRTREVRA